MKKKYELDSMSHFTMYQIREAIRHSLDGGQALHTHNVIVNTDTAPACFIAAVSRGENIAHLFDQDLDRLRYTARWLGVNQILVERIGESGQHVDLCGSPLRSALSLCERNSIRQGKLFS